MVTPEERVEARHWLAEQPTGFSMIRHYLGPALDALDAADARIAELEYEKAEHEWVDTDAMEQERDAALARIAELEAAHRDIAAGSSDFIARQTARRALRGET